MDAVLRSVDEESAEFAVRTVVEILAKRDDACGGRTDGRCAGRARRSRELDLLRAVDVSLATALETDDDESCQDETHRPETTLSEGAGQDRQRSSLRFQYP